MCRLLSEQRLQQEQDHESARKRKVGEITVHRVVDSESESEEEFDDCMIRRINKRQCRRRSCLSTTSSTSKQSSLNPKGKSVMFEPQQPWKGNNSEEEEEEEEESNASRIISALLPAIMTCPLHHQESVHPSTSPSTVSSTCTIEQVGNEDDSQDQKPLEEDDSFHGTDKWYRKDEIRAFQDEARKEVLADLAQRVAIVSAAKKSLTTESSNITINGRMISETTTSTTSRGLERYDLFRSREKAAARKIVLLACQQKGLNTNDVASIAHKCSIRSVQYALNLAQKDYREVYSV